MREEFECGLQFTHLMMMVTQDQGYETSAFVRALAEVAMRNSMWVAEAHGEGRSAG